MSVQLITRAVKLKLQCIKVFRKNASYDIKIGPLIFCTLLYTSDSKSRFSATNLTRLVCLYYWITVETEINVEPAASTEYGRCLFNCFFCY